VRIDLYSDVVCPWCYIGSRRLARALAAHQGEPVEVVHKPFQLDPTAGTGAPGSMRERLLAKYGPGAERMMAQTVEAARVEGIEIDYERARPANTLAAHQLMRLARDQGLDDELDQRLMRAYFGEGRDLNDRATLAELAAEVGLDRERAAGALASGEGLAEVQDEIHEAYRAGINAVPTMVFEGRFALPGAQDPEVILGAIAQVSKILAEEKAGGG
jgi:predicted DsbA family dithiol-disulfide isomerase